ncbi:MAG: nuclear transport factor 2 family protein [Rhizobiaceae bacterium]
MEEELVALKAAYKAWGERGWYALDVWRDLMDEEFTIHTTVDGTTPGLAFAAERNGRNEALIYLSGIFEDWDMVHYTPEHYLCQAPMIAMFGRCAYRHKKTGRVADCAIACLWRFENGRAVAFTEVFDTARAARAAIGA